MIRLEVEALEIATNETLMVGFHKRTGQWFASVGDLNKEDQRELVWAESSTAALAGLLLETGSGKIAESSKC